MTWSLLKIIRRVINRNHGGGSGSSRDRNKLMTGYIADEMHRKFYKCTKERQKNIWFL